MPEDPAHLLAMVPAGAVSIDPERVTALVKRTGVKVSKDDEARLVASLNEAAAHYVLSAALRPALRRVHGSTTNKPRLDLQNLIRDCDRAWRSTTGDRRPLFAGNLSHRKGNSPDSPGVELARICYQAATGRQLTQDLRRQVATLLNVLE